MRVARSGFLLSTLLVAAACGGTTTHSRAAAPPARTTVPDASSTVPAPSPTTTPPHPPGLGVGDSGPSVLAVQTRLAALHYDPGPLDGQFGAATQFAVVAFQKVTGMSRTGRATDDVVAALGHASDPAALVPGGGAMRVEVDLPRQVLFLFEHDALVRILPVSTGSGQRYCVDGQCDVAVTPGGSYRIGTKILGLQISRLGQLYNPLYFNGGIAIHGEPAVPSYPASHGCVRIPMNDSLWFFNEVPYGTPVYVVGGPHAPVPFNEQAPKPPSTTSTTPTTSTTSTTSTSVAPSTTTTSARPTTTTTSTPPTTAP